MERMQDITKYRKAKITENNNSLIIRILGEKPIAFNPSLGRLAKSATAGLFLSQLLYWDDKGANRNWIFKTIPNIQEETCLTRSEQDRAIKIWKTLNILKVELRGIPRRRYFHIDKDNLIKILTKPDSETLTNQYAESCNTESKLEQTLYTENTTEIKDNKKQQENNHEGKDGCREIIKIIRLENNKQ
jgi:hypothetical protein